jgi:hypothetical protein
MHDLTAPSHPILRPRLLMRAARIALPDYRRDRDLRRVLPMAVPNGDALDWLKAEEARTEAARCAGTAGWTALRHVELLTALLFELALAHGNAT